MRDIVHPERVPVRNLSLAEARLEAGASTALHYHAEAEEIYHVLAGRAVVAMAGEEAEIGPGEALPIRPRYRHRVINTGADEIVFLCLSSPAYAHQDAEIEADEE